MTTQQIKIFRETALPATLQPYSIYLIAPSARPNYVEMYVTNAQGSPKRNINQDDIQTMINSAVQAISQLAIVANIAARNALTLTSNEMVYVIDATDDITVKSGGATYLYNFATAFWFKVSDAQSLDVSFNWSSIQGAPTSTPAQIDNAVSQAHNHSNKTQLDQISLDTNNNILVNGSLTHIGFDSLGW